MATIKSKHFQSSLQQPLATPDGTSLEELVNAYLSTVSPANLIDVTFDFSQTGKYGASTLFIAQVVYKV